MVNKAFGAILYWWTEWFCRGGDTLQGDVKCRDCDSSLLAIVSRCCCSRAVSRNAKLHLSHWRTIDSLKALNHSTAYCMYMVMFRDKIRHKNHDPISWGSVWTHVGWRSIKVDVNFGTISAPQNSALSHRREESIAKEEALAPFLNYSILEYDLEGTSTHFSILRIGRRL